jgi:hypothetical protein
MASRPPESRAPVPDEVAKARWVTIQAARILGVALVVLGILLVRDVVDIAGETNHLIGYVFIAVGLADAFVMPQVLARKWRTPPE